MQKIKSGQNNVRVRFAPSPTGHLHIGSVRAAMFNLLFARHHGGSFLLRVEDTDTARSKQEYTDSIMEALAWCGIDYDETPVIQSSRIVEHKKMVATLVNDGKAYRCYCTPEEIIERQKARDGYNDLFSMYDGACRKRQVSDKDEKKSFVVRFKVPREQKSISFDDCIRGQISIDIDQFDDFIIARSDGTPMYNLVVVIDDAFMKISHVIRGEDHISNTPKQIMLYRACGFDIPKFAHLPLILGPSGDRLSKRDAATSVLDYKKDGYLPAALFNYLVRLGWSHGDQEIFTRQELVSYFSLEKVGKKGAIFDPAKLLWLNGVYLRRMESSAIERCIVKDIDPKLMNKLSNWTSAQRATLIDLYKERVKTLKDLAQQLLVLHNGPRDFDDKAIKKWIKPETKEHLERLVAVLEKTESFTHDDLAHAIKALCKDLSIKLVALAQPIRIALTGTSASPGIFVLLEIVGKKEVVNRLTALSNRLSA